MSHRNRRDIGHDGRGMGRAARDRRARTRLDARNRHTARCAHYTWETYLGAMQEIVLNPASQ